MTSLLYAPLKVVYVRKPALGSEMTHFPTWLHSDTVRHEDKEETYECTYVHTQTQKTNTC